MKKLLKSLLLMLLFLVVILFASFGYAYTQFQPVNSSQNQKATFVIPHGQSISVIGQRLQDQGLIKNALAFRFIVWQHKLGDKVQAGSFMLSPSMSVDEVAQQLTTGTNDVWVTVL